MVQAVMLAVSLVFQDSVDRYHRSNNDCLERKRENYEVCPVQYCVTDMHSAMHTHMNGPSSCLLVRFSFSVVILCVIQFIHLDLAFGNYFVL